MKKRILVGIVLSVLMSMVAVNSFADSGGWISGGTTGGGGSSSGGGSGGGGGGCSGDMGYYDLWCQGYSWIFYKYVGGASNSSAINFRRDETNNEIAKSCSEHGETGGFWHLGYNMRALSYNGIGYFGDFVGNENFVSSTYTYSTSPGGYGHAQTFDYKTIKNEYSYVYDGNHYITHSNSNLAHDIYKNGTKMYTASKYGSESEVLKAYQQAYKALYPNLDAPTALPDNVYAFCWWPDMDGSSFQGTSRVMEGNKPWDETPSDKRMQPDPLWYPDSKGNKQKTANTLVIKDCDLADGCSISFRHYLKRTSGNDSTKYTITRTVNGSSSTINSNVENNGVNKDNLIQLHPVTIFPGQKICETLEFYSDGKSDKASTTVCAAAIITKGADLGVEIRDQQSSVGYRDWRKDYVYAKPTDTVEVKGSYTPYYQAMYGLALPGKSKTNGFSNNNKTIGTTFNANVDPDWKNIFSIQVSNDCRKDVAGSVGSTDNYGGNDIYGFRIGNNDIGKKDVKAVTNVCNDTKNTPKQVSLTYSDKNWFAATVDTGTNESNTASVYVPYNFINETSITVAERIVYAGEAASIPYKITVKPKSNGKLDDTYATIVDGAEWKLEFCYGGQGVNCSWISGASNQKMHNGSSEDNYIYEEDIVENDSTVAKVNIPDVPAGTKVWVRSAVYPKDSGADDNLKKDYYNPNDANSWAYSEWIDLTVAKKPSFQVWGGSVYSAGDIEGLLTGKKRHIAGYNEFADVLDDMNAPTYVFGSWVELGLTAGGQVRELASGAGTGYTENNNGDLAANPGGSEESILNYCLRSTLSFANRWCNSGDGDGDVDYVGGLGETLQGAIGSDKSALIAKFTNGGVINAYGEVELSTDDENKKIDENIYYYNGDGNLTVLESNINKKATKVVSSNKSIYINGNIKYSESDYDSIEDIPKVIIYAAEDIIIDCGVERIDAVLIADGAVNTCVDENGNTPGVNDERRSNRLKINGSIISNTLDLNRTYGAATGVNSITPAEIVNYDTSLYLWSNRRSDITKTGKIMTAYQHELSPRY